MAFDQSVFGQLAYSDGFSLWEYATTDTVATCLGATYFNVSPPEMCAVGDLIICNASDIQAKLEVTAVGAVYLTVRDTGVAHRPVYADYLVPGMSVRTGASAPDLEVFQGSLRLLAFAGTGVTVEEGFFAVHILHDLCFGTDMSFHVHWGHNNASPSGDVKWQIDYSVVRGYGVSAYPAPTSLAAVQTAGAQYLHHITDDDDMIVSADTEIEPDSVLLGRIYRDPADAADTFEDDAFLFHIDLHYQKSQIGTTERNRPFTSAGFA